MSNNLKNELSQWITEMKEIEKTKKGQLDDESQVVS